MRSKRLAAGLSGDQLAEASGSYRNHYYELETGKHQARLSRIESVAQVFGLRASDLVREAEALLDAARAAARAA
jgi:transcriptional regulator with XRE-family HTH domain